MFSFAHLENADMLYLLLMSPNLNSVLKERMIIFNLNSYYPSNQTNINIMISIIRIFFLISKKVIGYRNKETQHPIFSFKNFDKFSHYVFLRVLQDKNCENDLYFYAFIFLMCQLGSSFYALFILLFFIGKLTFTGIQI